jgi:integrase
MKADYLRSRERRGRWFHYYRRNGREISLGVHGLEPGDARVARAYAAEHARWQERPPETVTPRAGTFAWAVDLYLASPEWKALGAGTRRSRMAILRHYLAEQGGRPLSSISSADLEAGLYALGGHAAVNHLKALKPIFAHAHRLRFVASDPARGLKMDRPTGPGFATADADDIAAYQARWPVGTVERLVFDLALYTGAARVDLVKLGRHNLENNVLIYTRQKTGRKAYVPLTHELRAVIARTPDIAPAFLLTSRGRPYTAEGLGNMFRDAARAAGCQFRLHGLRKAFCVYWAEQGCSAHKIAAMAGHATLAEVQRYTVAADRRRMIELLVEGA